METVESQQALTKPPFIRSIEQYRDEARRKLAHVHKDSREHRKARAEFFAATVMVKAWESGADEEGAQLNFAILLSGAKFIHDHGMSFMDKVQNDHIILLQRLFNQAAQELHETDPYAPTLKPRELNNSVSITRRGVGSGFASIGAGAMLADLVFRTEAQQHPITDADRVKANIDFATHLVVGASGGWLFHENFIKPLLDSAVKPIEFDRFVRYIERISDKYNSVNDRNVS